MTGRVNTRNYDSSRRKAAAVQTRQRILSAARGLFLDRGYEATTIAAIAEAAGVAIDTVYATVGRKPLLVRLLMETAISGTDEAVPPLEREYVQRVKAASSGGERLRIYASAAGSIMGRLAPLFRVLREAAPAEPEIASLVHEISERRRQNMDLFVADVAAASELRLSASEAADIIWAMNSPEFYLLLVGDRDWPPERFASWLGDTWVRLLLAAESPPGS